MATETKRPHPLLAVVALLLGALGFVALLALSARSPETLTDPSLARLFLADPAQLMAHDLAELREQGFRGVVLDVSRHGARGAKTLADALAAARDANLSVDYWIEVGRDPIAAATHPSWLHRPHKTAFYGGAPIAIGEWVCVNNREVFDYELERVATILGAAPRSAGRLFLNDLLGAPEGCGCGNVLCRLWDGSLGAKISADDGPAGFGADPVAPLLFCEAVETRFPELRVVPVITEECAAGVSHCGVADPETTLGYGRMLCTDPDGLESYPRLIGALSARPEVGLLALDRTFGRDVPEFGAPGSWVGAVLDRYLDRDPRRHLWAVVEGWELGAASVRDRLRIAEEHGARGAIVAGKAIDQSWSIADAEDFGAEM